MNKRIILFFLLLAVTLTARPEDKKSRQKINIKWSERMANTILSRSDSLIYYVDKNPKWAYDVAFLGMAIDRLGKTDKRYSKYMEDWVNHFVKPDGSVIDYQPDEYNLDRIFPGRDVFTLYKRNPDQKYKVALDNFINQFRTHPKTNSGGYWHKNIYPWQMWLDGIFMASPFMAEYAKEFNAPEWFDTACIQTKMIYSKTLDPATGLLMHAWDESRSQKWCDKATGKSHYPWSRSMGWYVLAIEDILEYLPTDHPDRSALIDILQKTCEALLKVKDRKTGLWYQVLNCGGQKGNYLEGSGSAMYVYAFARGAHRGYLDKKFLDIAGKSFDGIIRELITSDSNGLLTMHNICGGCGLGGNPYRDGSYEYYVTEKRVDNDTKGVAPFIMAALELNR
jgi:unsaturated rhamnogalacturonyl hydrolase